MIMQKRSFLASTLWRRHQNPWNWLVQLLGVLLVALAVWLHRGTEAGAGLALFLVGMLDFRLPRFPVSGRFSKRIRRWIRAEVVWVNKPWTRSKRIEAALLFLATLFMLAVLWWGSLPGLGLTVGGFVLLQARRANRDAGIDP